MLVHQAQQKFIAGFHRVNKAFFQRLNAIPVFTRRYLLDIQLRAHPVDKVFEESMGIVEIFAEFLAPFFGIFAQHRQGTFVLPGRMQLNVDVLVLKKTIDVGDLRHNANRAKDSERRADDSVRHAGHHIAAAGRNFIYRDR